jgi:hypothetical protein
MRILQTAYSRDLGETEVMAKVRKEAQKELLDHLSDLGYGQADREDDERFIRRFYPVKQHLRAFDPDVTLVVGERGTGKSALFKAVFENNLLAALAPFAPDQRLPFKETDRIKLVPGFPIGREFPDQRGLRNIAGAPERFADLWFAYLIRILRDEIDSKEELGFLDFPGGAPDKVLRSFDDSGNEPLLALDRLDQELLEANQWLFIGYDELDTLGGFAWATMAKAIQGLVAFWSSYARRWQRIRAKIFLRTDLFRRHAGLGGADLAKLAANRVELVWSDHNLFSMLIKRIANNDEQLFAYCKTARVPFKKERHELFGYIPALKKADDARPLIERMIGQYMGETSRKGQSFNWILDHIRDGHKCATPRALVRLFEQAATKERGNPRAAPPRLLHPTSLRQALEDVSKNHVIQGINNEWPWLHGVKARIAENRLAPWKRRELQDMLNEDWEGTWGQGGESIVPPAQNARELIDYLVELGVFRERANDRIDVPDIYLFGLELRRKGGVRRK